ncbi:MAG: hypothetical protein C4519_07135 [Desulfobacteraceae bacterium]|nr:MAG: hypothetical protein C4519_07135 [Desulfobacteraceae bacterium]
MQVLVNFDGDRIHGHTPSLRSRWFRPASEEVFGVQRCFFGRFRYRTGNDANLVESDRPNLPLTVCPAIYLKHPLRSAGEAQGPDQTSRPVQFRLTF